jgi:glycosyltransferase involved in cell wall biosynthesis
MGEINVSVVMPVYNVEDYLEGCIDSVLNQTMSDLELICVDDGSTDLSCEILEYFRAKDPRVVVLHQQNNYAGVARNAGLKIAKGKYVMFLDSDDFFDKNLLAEMYEKAESCRADIVICDAHLYDDASGRFKEPGFYLRRGLVPEQEVFSWRDLDGNILNISTPAPWNKIYRREFIMENGLEFQDVKRNNDVRFYAVSMALAARIAALPKRLVNYRRGHSGNLQSRNTETPLLICDVLRAVRDEYEKAGIMEEFRQNFCEFAMSTLMYHVECMTSEESFRKLAGYIRETIDAEFSLSDIQETMWTERWEFYRRIVNEDLEALTAERFTRSDREEMKINKHLVDFDPRVSVIIPAYNVENYVRGCLDSLTTQMGDEMEIICVDDGSTDGTLDIFMEYAGRDKRFVVVSAENGGVSAARNRGVQCAAGKYILFLDSDDMLVPGAFEKLLNRAEADDLDILIFNAQVLGLEDDDELAETVEYYKKYFERKGSYRGSCTGPEMFYKMSMENEFLPAVNRYFYRRETIVSQGLEFYEGIIHEDELYSVAALMNADRCGYIPDKLYIRTIRKGSIMTSSKSEKNFIGYFIAFTEMMKIYRTSLGVLDDRVTWTIALRARRIYDNACRIYQQLNSSQRKRIDFSGNPEAAGNFEVYRFEADRKQKLERDLKKEKKKCRYLKSELDMRFYDRCRRFMRRKLWD